MGDTFVHRTIQTFSRRRGISKLNEKCRFLGRFLNNPARDGAEIAPNVVHCEFVRRAEL